MSAPTGMNRERLLARLAEVLRDIAVSTARRDGIGTPEAEDDPERERETPTTGQP
jgi:hypothetical protein